MNSYFKNKNYVILGAANGYGMSLAFDLADRKANLFLLDIDNKLIKLCRDLSKKTKCQCITLDIKNYNETTESLIKMM